MLKTELPHRDAVPMSARNRSCVAGENITRHGLWWVMIAVQFIAALALVANEGAEILENEAQFTDSLIDALHDAEIRYEFEAGEGVEVFAVENGVRILYLSGRLAYENYLEDPSSKGKQLFSLVSIVKQAENSSARAPALSKLVPLLRSRDWLERAGADNIPFAVLPEGPLIVLAEDQGNSIRHLQAQDFAKLARPFDELVAIAVANLRTIAPASQENLGSVLMLTSGGDYEASLALDKKLIADVSKSLGGEVIFTFPTTDLFLVGPSDQSALGTLARVIGGQLLDGGELLTSSIYQYHRDELTVFARVTVVEGQITVSTVGGQ